MITTSPRIQLIVGLGNPGSEYAGTYHNAGVIAVKRLAKELHASTAKTSSLYTYSKAGSYVLLMPRTFMNDSGSAVRKALAFFKISPESLLVIHDDSDISLGASKLGFGRGAAGHRGVQSIIDQLGTKNFWRLRLGIRRARGKAGDFVLRAMNKTDLETLYSTFDGTITKLIEKETP